VKRSKGSDPWLFVTERGEPFTRHGIAYIIREAGERAGLGHVNPHMLRHSCGYHLANLSQVPDVRLIQAYLKHRNIKNTARYTRLSARRFEGLWV
jgi:site-specific recombinase XerD